MENNRTKQAAVRTGLCRTPFPYILTSLVFLCSLGLVSAAGPPMLGEILGKTEVNYRSIHAFTAIFHHRPHRRLPAR